MQENPFVNLLIGIWTVGLYVTDIVLSRDVLIVREYINLCLRGLVLEICFSRYYYRLNFKDCSHQLRADSLKRSYSF